MAAPVAGKILGEVLPYLELKQDNDETKEHTESVAVPDVMYKTVEEAEKIFKEAGLEIQYQGKLDKTQKQEKIITEQIPSGGITINKGSKIQVSFE